MALSYRARKILAVLVIAIGMPLYVVLAVNLIDLANAQWGRQPFWIEFAIFVALGIIWILPFKSLFKGIGQPDPKAAQQAPQQSEAPDDKR